ncbi:hypothetical protein MC885_014541 [Smutsia gigantea]|nr:hypothetical protein MC885_014541 [Smutsia gigantea]
MAPLSSPAFKSSGLGLLLVGGSRANHPVWSPTAEASFRDSTNMNLDSLHPFPQAFSRKPSQTEPVSLSALTAVSHRPLRPPAPGALEAYAPPAHSGAYEDEINRRTAAENEFVVLKKAAGGGRNCLAGAGVGLPLCLVTQVHSGLFSLFLSLMRVNPCCTPLPSSLASRQWWEGREGDQGSSFRELDSTCAGRMGCGGDFPRSDLPSEPCRPVYMRAEAASWPKCGHESAVK